MEFEKLTAQVRAGRKKGVARRLRRDGLIPAVCYGRDVAPIALSVDPVALRNAVSGSLGRNTVMELTIEGDGAPSDPVLVMLQDHQYHAVNRSVLHADFLQVSLDRDVSIDVPFKLEGKAIGVQAGGVMAQVFWTLPMVCPIDKIPPEITLDVSEMEIGDIRKISDLHLPEGVRVELEQTRTVANVATPTVAAAAEAEEEGEEGEAAEGEPAAAGEEKPEAAPAAE